MIVVSLDSTTTAFPPVEFATEIGLLAVGGDLKPERLIEAYRNGIFPWYSEGEPILWWSPDPRAVLPLERLKVPRSLAKRRRNAGFRVSTDTCFGDVVQACAAPRGAPTKEPGTWITDEMFVAYCRLNDCGYAHSVETWLDGRLVGGLYGVCLGGMFFGESMFSLEPDASKIALVCLVDALRHWEFELIDCQQPSSHLARLGAENRPRNQFMANLASAMARPDRVGKWELSADKRDQHGRVDSDAAAEIIVHTARRDADC